MSRPTQSLLVLVTDEADLPRIADALRAVPCVTEVRIGTFHHEHAGKSPVELFVPRPPEPAPAKPA